jgi:ATP-dependent Lon protease
MQTQELKTYIEFMTTAYPYTNSDAIATIIQEDAISVLKNDMAHVSKDIITALIDKEKEYIQILTEQKNVELFNENEHEKNLYDQAITACIIDMIGKYIASHGGMEFSVFLDTFTKSKMKSIDTAQEPNKFKPKIMTMPLTTLLSMLIPNNKKRHNTFISKEPDTETDSDSEYLPESPVRETKRHKTDKQFLNEMFKNSSSDNDEKEISKYYSNLPKEDKIEMFDKLHEINNYQRMDKPKVFQIMNFPIPTSQKNHILKQYITLLNSHSPDNKSRTWFDSVMSLPFGKYKGIDMKTLNKPNRIKKFLTDLNTIMDDAVWGHNDAKRQIIQMMGQQIRNPGCKGSVIGIWGPPGNGKTTLIKEGIAKAMNKPFVFISLGGATDASFLDGHSYTYEGSVYGRIANGLITSGCMNPIIYFDELDKISRTPKGDEITNLLVHLTDPAQNSHFRDKYFHGIDIDLSKATIIFSFNNISNVNPILLDRITTIETKYLMKPHKIHIAQNYLLPNIMKETGLNSDDIKISDKNIGKLIEKYTREGGVRKLKSLLYNVVREVNLSNLMKTPVCGTSIIFPMKLQHRHIKEFMKNKLPIQPEKVHSEPKVGFITGMYAGSLGVGGVLPIQILWVPASQPMTLKATGNLRKVIKESTQVATSLAWNSLSKEEQTKYLAMWKDKPVGFHIHCPDGAIPKDGPSAGTALTVALYSMLSNKVIRHDVAITGEITLEGKVTAIGGLEEKLVGAKKAGVKLALIPRENEKHLLKVNERNPTLIDDEFKVIMIDTLNDALKHSLL